MEKGEIYKLKSEYREYYSPECYKHPFIFWEDEGAGYRGIMLTTSDKPEYENIELKKEHFNSGYEIVYGIPEKKPKSYIAPLYLLKDVEYEHLEKVGELSDDGETFINSIKDTLDYTDWLTHMKLIRAKKISINGTPKQNNRIHQHIT